MSIKSEHKNSEQKVNEHTDMVPRFHSYQGCKHGFAFQQLRRVLQVVRRPEQVVLPEPIL